MGNKANHQSYENKKDALECLASMYKVAAWFYIKVTKYTSIKPLTYKMPKATSIGAKGYNVEDYVKKRKN